MHLLLCHSDQAEEKHKFAVPNSNKGSKELLTGDVSTWKMLSIKSMIFHQLTPVDGFILEYKYLFDYFNPSKLL